MDVTAETFEAEVITARELLSFDRATHGVAEQEHAHGSSSDDHVKMISPPAASS
jgi:hypothetical protein